MFTDFVNFTGISENLTPGELVEEIHKNFTAFDAIMEKHGIEKIKTIGDAYLAVCGLPNEVEDHAQRITKAALEIQAFMLTNGGKFQVRIGIHSGQVVAGIVGVKKFAYDIWGDTVNMANRMESNSEPGKINISQATYELIKEEFACEHRGKINAKNKGEVDMYFVSEEK
jgi:class 3 adenylate cyclase